MDNDTSTVAIPHRAGSGGRRSRSRYYHRYTRCKRQNNFLRVFLLGGLLAISAMGAFAYRYISKAGETINIARAENTTYKNRIQELEETIAQLNDEVLALSQGRIPGLRPIQFDQVLRVDKEYVKNLVFSITRKGADNTYEFKMVMHNQGPDIVQPSGSVALFDRAGLQLGITEFKKVDGSLFLAPGETRSYYDKIELARSGRPAYYMLELN
ncbi:MAG: hypothetical protein PVF91_15495 [Chromatiales bacterium]|jgi:cell division protein FtsB